MLSHLPHRIGGDGVGRSAWRRAAIPLHGICCHPSAQSAASPPHGLWTRHRCCPRAIRPSCLTWREKQNARVILVGDVKQLGSVEAGAAFAQLQGAGMETAKLGEIVRQTNTATKDAVLASIAGRRTQSPCRAGSGRRQDHRECRPCRSLCRHRQSNMPRWTRPAAPATLVIEPSREGRDTLTADIRAALAKSGALTGPAVNMQSLANKGLTRAEARDPMSYDKGDVVRFTRDYADKGVARGEAYRVESIDPAKAAITLKSEDGREVDWRLRQWGAGNAQTFAPQSLELKTGDRIQFTRNDREAGRINGARGEVTAIDAQARTADDPQPARPDPDA